MQESEYAAWVLVNGYALNHTTVAVHHLKGLTYAEGRSSLHQDQQQPQLSQRIESYWWVFPARRGGIQGLVQTLQEQGFRLNEAGGPVKVTSGPHAPCHGHQAQPLQGKICTTSPPCCVAGQPRRRPAAGVHAGRQRPLCVRRRRGQGGAGRLPGVCAEAAAARARAHAGESMGRR